jgi:hypothetical protein
VSAELHKAVKEGVWIKWREADWQLNFQEFEKRDSDFMNVALKLHGMQGVEEAIVKNWVQRLTGWEDIHFKVAAMPYQSVVEKHKGTKVWGVYTRHLDWLRRLYLLTQINKVDPTDTKGNTVEDWTAAMPYVKRSDADGDYGRKLFMRGTAKETSRQLARVLAGQLEMIREEGIDVFAINGENRMPTGGAFLVMRTHQQAAQILEKIGLVNSLGYPMDLYWAEPRKGTNEDGRKRSYAETVGWAPAGMAGGGTMDVGAVARETANEVDRMLQAKYQHLATKEHMQEQVRAGILAERKMFEAVAYQAAHEANKILYKKMEGYFGAIKIAVDTVGKAVAERRGDWSGSEEERRAVMTPQVNKQLANVAGQKRAAPEGVAGANMAELPGLVNAGSSAAQCSGFLDGMLQSTVGQELLRQAGNLPGDDGRYTPPHMRAG